MKFKRRNELVAIYEQIEELRQFVLELFEGEEREAVQPGNAIDNDEFEELPIAVSLSSSQTPDIHKESPSVNTHSRIPWTKIVFDDPEFEKHGPVECFRILLERCEKEPTAMRLSLLCELFNEGSLFELCGSEKTLELGDRVADLLSKHENIGQTNEPVS